MMHSRVKKMTDNVQILLVIPLVLVLIISFLMLTRNIILNLSKEKMALQSKAYADNLIVWAEQIVSQLNVYKTILEEEGNLDEHTVDVLTASYGVHEGYPFGLYWGDENKNFYDVSGWDPGPEYDPTKRSWYAEGLEHTDSFEFGEPYIDMRTGKPSVTATVKAGCTPVTTIIAADVYFDHVTNLLENISQNDIDRAFLVTGNTRLIIADSDWNMAGTTLDQAEDSVFHQKINQLIDAGFVGMTTVAEEEKFYVNICRIEELDWFLVTCMKEADMMRNLRHVNVYIYGIGMAASILLGYLTRKVSRVMTAVTRKAKTDPLTKLLNRDGFVSMIKTALKRNPGHGILLIFDVDNFKRVNDELGHPVGDRFLTELAELLEEYFNRSTDFCSRLGGDEFAVFVDRKLGTKELSIMLEKFMERFHKAFDERYAEQHLSVSIGAAFVEAHDGYAAEDLYKCADKALYQAKENGKDCYVINGQE